MYAVRDLDDTRWIAGKLDVSRLLYNNSWAMFDLCDMLEIPGAFHNGARELDSMKDMLQPEDRIVRDEVHLFWYDAAMELCNHAHDKPIPLIRAIHPDDGNLCFANAAMVFLFKVRNLEEFVSALFLQV